MNISLSHHNFEAKDYIFKNLYALGFGKFMVRQFFPEMRITEFEDDVGMKLSHLIGNHTDSVIRIDVRGNGYLPF